MSTSSPQPDPETRVRRTLDALGLDYEILPCDPELADTAVFCAHYGYPLENSANTIVAATKTGGPRRYAACVLLATTRLDVNNVVRKRLGARRVSFASAEETRAATGMDLGGVTPLGLPEDLALWVDARVMETKYVILGAGSRSAKVQVSPEIFHRLPSAEIVEGLAKPPPRS